MRYISERDKIKEALKFFILAYSSGKHGYQKVVDTLKTFDPETVSKEEIDNTIGNTTWTRDRCSECGDYYSEIFMLGEEPDYESNTAYLCTGCMQEAVNLFNSVESNRP